MPATKTRKLSSQLADLEAKREEAYAALREGKRQRNAYEAEIEAQRAAVSAFIASRPEDHRDAAQNPWPDSPSGKKQAKLKARLQEPNPYGEAFDLARAEFHAVDEELQRFRINRLPEVIAEADPETDALDAKRDEALHLLIEYAEGYAQLQGRAEQLISECPLLTGQHITADALPRQLGAMARSALDHPTTAPAISEVGLHKLEQHR